MVLPEVSNDRVDGTDVEVSTTPDLYCKEVVTIRLSHSFVVGGTFLLAFVFCFSLFMVGWEAESYLSTMDGVIVTPFQQIYDEYYPNSVKPCEYPPLENLYNDSYLCNCK